MLIPLDKLNDNFGLEMKSKRKEFGFSQRALAKLLDVSQATINSWENNEFYPSCQKLFKMLDLFYGGKHEL